MNIESIEIEKLRLDPKNPRLPKSIDREEFSMLRYIAEKYSIEELMMSIGENGFFLGEPIIAIRDKDKYIVIEGNRRLTAVKLLSNPGLINRPTFQQIAEEAKQEPPVELPVVVFDSRELVTNYLGHRHITGVKSWSSFAKARYLFSLYCIQLGQGKEKDESIRAVARIIGSRRDYVLRILGSLAVCKIIENNNYFDFENVGEHNLPFSVFYTAFQRSEIREYVGYPDFFSDDNESVNLDNLKNLTEWFCVKKPGGGTVLVNPGNLENLANILDDEKARVELENGASIDEAIMFTGTYIDEFSKGLHTIKRGLSQLNYRVAEIEFDDDLDSLIRDVLRQVRNLRDSWNNKKSNEGDL